MSSLSWFPFLAHTEVWYIIFIIECIDWNSITVFFSVAADQSAEKLEEKLDAHDEESTEEEKNEEKWWIDQVLKVANILFISFWELFSCILVIFCLFTFFKSTHFARQDRNLKNKKK